MSMGVLIGALAIGYIVGPLLIFLKVAASSSMDGRKKTWALSLLTAGYVLATVCAFLALDAWIGEVLHHNLQTELAKNGIRSRSVSSPMFFWYNPNLM